MTGNISNTSQELRVLKVLQDANGEWVNGQHFLRDLYLSQYHRAIYNLQNKRDKYIYEGTIEASEFTDEFKFKSYRLKVEEQKPQTNGPVCPICEKAGGQLLPITTIHYKPETLSRIPSRLWWRLGHQECVLQYPKKVI